MVFFLNSSDSKTHATVNVSSIKWSHENRTVVTRKGKGNVHPRTDHESPEGEYSDIARAESDGTRAETRIHISPKRTSPLKSLGASVQSTAGSRGVHIGFSNAAYTTFGGGLRVLATHSICQFPLHFPSRASPCATRFRTSSTSANEDNSLRAHIP